MRICHRCEGAFIQSGQVYRLTALAKGGSQATARMWQFMSRYVIVTIPVRVDGCLDNTRYIRDVACEANRKQPRKCKSSTNLHMTVRQFRLETTNSLLVYLVPHGCTFTEVHKIFIPIYSHGFMPLGVKFLSNKHAYLQDNVCYNFHRVLLAIGSLVGRHS